MLLIVATWVHYGANSLKLGTVVIWLAVELVRRRLIYVFVQLSSNEVFNVLRHIAFNHVATA